MELSTVISSTRNCARELLVADEEATHKDTTEARRLMHTAQFWQLPFRGIPEVDDDELQWLMARLHSKQRAYVLRGEFEKLSVSQLQSLGERPLKYLLKCVPTMRLKTVVKPMSSREIVVTALRLAHFETELNALQEEVDALSAELSALKSPPLAQDAHE